MKKLMLTAVAAAIALALGVAQAQTAPPRSPARAPARSAFDNLDPNRLAAQLRDLQMTELLEALVAQSGGNDAMSILASAKISAAAAALKAGEQGTRDKLLDEAIAIQDKLIAATKGALKEEEKLKYFRNVLDRIFTEGGTKVKPYAMRIEYFLNGPNDAPTVAKSAGRAMKLLEAALSEMEMTYDRWNADDNLAVVGIPEKVQNLIREGRYQGAWIRYNLGVVSPAGLEKTNQLKQAIVDVKEFADWEDNSIGVKWESLKLSGMCCRELGEYANARDFLNRAAAGAAAAVAAGNVTGGESDLRLKCWFEIAHCWMDEGLFPQAAKASADFAENGAKEFAKLPERLFDVKLQAEFLKMHLLECQAEAAEKSGDKAGAAKFRGEAVGGLIKFADAQPEKVSKELYKLIIPKFKGGDASKLEPAAQLAVANDALGERTPAGTARGEKILGDLLKNEAASADVKAACLWKLGLLKAEQKQNIPSAEFFIEQAEKYPKSANARNAAMNAVKIYFAIINERGGDATTLPPVFQDGYIRALKVAVTGWGKEDKEIGNNYAYELIVMLDRRGRSKEAIATLSYMDEANPLYIPAKFKTLNQRVLAMLEHPPLDKLVKESSARGIIQELRDYQGRARKYAATAGNEAKAKDVLAWGAECGFMISQIYKELLGNFGQAVTEAEAVGKDWKDVPGIGRRVRETIIRVRLEEGKKVEEIAPLLQKLLDEDAKGAEELLEHAVYQLRARIERLTDPAANEEQRKSLPGARDTYRSFVIKLLELPGANDKRKEIFLQARAYACEWGDKAEAEEGIKILEPMYDKQRKEQEKDPQKPVDAALVLNLARCHRQAGNFDKALDLYNLLKDGLSEGSNDWWRVGQLERLSFALDQSVKDIADAKTKDRAASVLKAVLVQIRVLRNRDKGDMGSYYTQFNKIESTCVDTLKGMGITPPAPPAIAPTPEGTITAPPASGSKPAPTPAPAKATPTTGAPESF